MTDDIMKPREWFATFVIGSDDEKVIASADEQFIDKIFWKEKWKLVDISAFDAVVKELEETQLELACLYDGSKFEKLEAELAEARAEHQRTIELLKGRNVEVERLKENITLLVAANDELAKELLMIRDERKK